jgi:hypothetical protein
VRSRESIGIIILVKAAGGICGQRCSAPRNERCCSLERNEALDADKIKFAPAPLICGAGALLSSRQIGAIFVVVRKP